MSVWNRPILAMVGLGTDGSDDLEPGIHLRWGFCREVGFPPNGFCLYRRPAQKPPIVCFDFDSLLEVRDRKSVTVRSESLELTISSDTPILSEKRPLRWLEQVIKVQNEIGIATRPRGEVVLLRSSKYMRISVPPTPVALVVGIAPKGTRIVGAAYASDRVVDLQQATGTGSVVGLLFRGDRIVTIELKAKDIRIVQVCIAREEPCESMNGWKPLVPCPLCLPVTRGAYKCGDRRAGCDEETALSRLPKYPCARSKYGGENLRNLLDAVRAVVDPDQGSTMGSRMLDYPVSFDDCPPPETAAPNLGISALDLLLITSIDPAIARILGLYYADTDTTPGQAYDYKIVGSWPEGTLWTLENSVDFDARQPGQVLPPGFVHAGLTFVADGSFSVVKAPTNFAGTKNAIQLQPDRFDWSTLFPAAADGSRRLFISFDRPVGEVQVYARQGGAGLTLTAYRKNAQVARVNTANPDSLLAVHAPEIDMLALIGDLRWLYKLHYGFDYIPHGNHCYIVYGLTAGHPAQLAAPSAVASIALPGVTRKKNDCEPLLEGSLTDTRYPVGVRWVAPTAPDGTLLSRDPILFDIERENPDASTALLTEDQPLMVTPSATESPKPPPGWPKERPYFIDAVPHPGSYRYRVAGIDIFGRRSDFSDWSDAVPVEPLPPPSPASVTAKWLDPADPFLTESERQWVEADARAGVLVTWEWLETQDRQSPYVEAFHILFEKGWLNTLLGMVKEEPVEGAGAFSLQVVFDRRLAANVLAGMTMSHQGVPYQIRSNDATDANAPFVSTLVCRKPSSGTPKNFKGQIVSVPLLTSVHAKVQSIQNGPNGTKDIQIFTRDLGAVPSGGIVGGVLIGAGQRWDIVSATGVNVVASGVRVKVRVFPGKEPQKAAPLFALLGKTGNLELPSPSPPYKDYRLTANWPMQLGPVPADGAGLYQVFVRTAADGEALGRTSIASRQHRFLTDATLLDGGGIAYGQTAVAAAALGQTGTSSAPATYARVSREKPGAPAALVPADDLTPIYASYPNYHGKASYAYRWPRAANTRYVVYRALDETLFDVDRRVRSSRSKARNDWHSFLSQFPDPDGTLRDEAFNIFVTQANPPDYQELSNRLLQILASFPDLEGAFTKLHPDPISWDDPEYADWVTEIAGPGEAAYVPNSNLRLYVDESLPGQGSNRYFYRVKAIDVQGNAASLSVSTPPIWLRRVVVPHTPILTAVTGSDGEIVLRWVSNREPDVAAYHVYRANAPERVRDLKLMDRVHIVAVAAGAPEARSVEVEWRDTTVIVYMEHYYRITAVDGVGNESPPTAPAVVRSYSTLPLEPPSGAVPQWMGIGTDRFVRLTWVARPGVAVLVQRRVAGTTAWRTVGMWSEPGAGTLDDLGADPAELHEYRFRARDPSGRQSEPSAEITVPTPP